MVEGGGNALWAPARTIDAGERDARMRQQRIAAHDVDRLAVHFETFIEEFSNILQRQG